MRLFTILFIFCLLGCNNFKKTSNIIFPSGGYSFPNRIDNRDTNFFCYPLKNLISRSDSFREAYYGYYFYHSFNEPNLSLRPTTKTIFRFSYEGWQQQPFIINLSEQAITIKKALRYIYPEEDDNKLTEIEKSQYYLLRRRFPLNENKHNPEVKHRVDSMIKLYPQLLDPNYYRALIAKTVVDDKQPFTYMTETLSITKEKFNYIVNLINESGYWSLPYQIRCDQTPTDGYGFVLEGNNGIKFNIVKSIGCPGDTSKYTKACQELIKLARLNNNVDLVWPRN